MSPSFIKHFERCSLHDTWNGEAFETKQFRSSELWMDKTYYTMSLGDEHP